MYTIIQEPIFKKMYQNWIKRMFYAQIDLLD